MKQLKKWKKKKVKKSNKSWAVLQVMEGGDGRPEGLGMYRPSPLRKKTAISKPNPPAPGAPSAKNVRQHQQRRVA